MKAKELRELSPSELQKKLRDTREALLNLRVQKEVGQVENTAELRALRRSIARMETLLQQKQTAAA